MILFLRQFLSQLWTLHNFRVVKMRTKEHDNKHSVSLTGQYTTVVTIFCYFISEIVLSSATSFCAIDFANFTLVANSKVVTECNEEIKILHSNEYIFNIYKIINMLMLLFY